ncbi:MAG: hypothetical protein ACD_7C00506G0002 [uncultured bacterium]|nr:MAG: hypothetical protein ACD_7C00506G0002 [uncultured bacterium]KKP67935.1 MAG: hypothetical protein UR66_C0009G0025 [Candidatus Moranbacteria bacterium GW2011_GWE1_35_17]KKP84405.1 MAG: hypothetical protein UR82_C0007G0004 [Candidatus Moranbacteria bacterium GW2011_GWF1_35_5]HBR78920.1 hypothetical protein [Candidatus Moranbacteria bacterium]
MEVFINSRKKIIRENQLEILEAQFVDFLEYLAQTKHTPKSWIAALGSDSAISTVLNGCRLKALATETGIAYLRKKSEELEILSVEEAPNGERCPLGIYRDY